MDASSTAATCDLINQLITLHARSLPVYLSDASPWITEQHAHAKDVLDIIAADQLFMVDRLFNLMLKRDGTVAMGGFPMEFTGWHDLSLDFLLMELVRRQERDAESIHRISQQLAHDPEARELAEEAWGAAKAHCEALRELQESGFRATV